MTSEYYQYQRRFTRLIEAVSLRMRKKIFQAVMQATTPCSMTTVLDVGVTSSRRKDSNIFEKLYPHPERITAVGLEDCSFLEEQFPGLEFIKGNGLNLPFADGSFDLAVSFATIEHVGSRERQHAFVRELCRVARICCLTTPNRWYPLEFHTLLPLAHWLPAPQFRAICRFFDKEFYARESHLNLLSERQLVKMFPSDIYVCSKRFRLFGPVSNLLTIATSEHR